MLDLRLPAGAGLALLLAACSSANAPKIYVASWDSRTVNSYTAAGAQTAPTIALAHELEALAVDAAGKVYVAESDSVAKTDSVVTYSATGEPASPTISGLRCVSGLAVDAAGKIYVANDCEGSLTAYTADGVKTTPTITGLGSPQGIAVDATGKIYIFNFDNNTLTTYTAAGVRTTPRIPSLSELFAVDASGKIYAAATDGSLVAYKADGTQTATVAPPKGTETYDVATDEAGKLYVLSGASSGNQSTLTTYNADGTPGSPTIAGLPGKLSIKLDRSTTLTSLPIVAVR